VPTSTSRWAYLDCYDIYDRALDTPRGVRVGFDTEGHAKHFRVRLHTARKLEREQNMRIHPADHPEYGVSEYDKLSTQLVQASGKWWIYIQLNKPGLVEDIPEEEEGRTIQDLVNEALSETLEPVHDEEPEPVPKPRVVERIRRV
jgi:hypothetical protein